MRHRLLTVPSSLAARCVIALALCSLETIASPVRAEEFPYVAYAAADDVYVRSGPGESYYPTSKLQAGQEVEIYRHDPGGWYAIRPPEGSFSWVSAEHIRPTEGNWAVVAGDRVVARVGSDFNDHRDVIQVHLDRGEEVEILEARRFGQGRGAQTWYKIAPPAGEFRWVYGKFVSDSPAPSEGPQRRRNLLIDDAADSAASAEPAVDPSTAADLPDDADLSDSEDVAVDPSAGGEPTDGDLETATQTARIDRAALEAALQRTAPVGEWTTAQFQDELVDIDVALAGMLSRQTSEWNLQPLLDRAEAAIGHAHNSIERGRARLLVKKIKNFDDLARRSQLIARGQTGDGSRSAQQPAAGHDPRTSSLDRRYDGVGRLTPVYSRRLGAPDYALVDDQGKVRCYVTAAPGVNLRNYVGKTVGVTGTLGYAAELSSQHLTAQRVTAIDAPVLR